MTAGRKRSVVWNGTDSAGGRVASGIYLCKLTTDDVSMTRRMVLLK